MPVDPLAIPSIALHHPARRARTCAWVILAAQVSIARAQAPGAAPTVPASLTGSLAGQVWQRLDPLATALVLIGALILLLLVVRVVQTVRRERPVRRTVVRPRSGVASDTGSLGSLDRPTITANTDWGFDQNKRSSVTRRPGLAAAASAAAALAPSHWSKSEVHNAAQASFQPRDSMGKPANLPPSPYRTSHNPYFTGETAGSSMAMEVEEVADVLLQSELLVQLGDPKQAMLLLSQHIRETEQPGPAVWLMLLNLYQTTGRKSQYDALARGFVTLFNAAVPPWANSSEEGARDLESYPQVMMRLQTGWPAATIRPFLDGLLNDDRGGSRQGFSLTAYREILFLIEVLNVLDRMTTDDEERDRIQQKLDT